MKNYISMKFYGYLLLAFLLFSCQTSTEPDYPLPEHGFIDLSEWDFENNGLVALTGTWKYIWMQDSASFAEPGYDDSAWDTIAVPTTFYRARNEPFGYAWLRLKVIKSTDIPLRLYFCNSVSASEIYCNGDKILSFGVAANKEEEFQVKRTVKTLLLPSSDTIHFSWKISNLKDELGGPRRPFIIGTDSDILTFQAKESFRSTVIFGIIFIIFLYHVIIWFSRRNDYSSLYFALFCLVLLVRLFDTEIIHIFDFSDYISFNVVTVTEIMTLPLASLLFLLFLSRMYPNEKLKKVQQILYGILVVLTIIPIVTDGRFYTSILPLFQIVLLIVSVVCIIIITKAILRKRRHSMLMMSGILVMVLCVVYDIFITHVPHTSTHFTVSFGLIYFIIIQSSVLSFKFADAYKTAEHLTKNLQDEVKNKTQDIQLKSEALKKMNTELKRSDEYKTRFFQNITHEFKTPLTLVTGPVKSILNNQYGEINDDLKKPLQVVKNNGLKTLNLVNQLLELAKSDAKEQELKLTKTNIGAFLKVILSNFESLAERKKVSVSFINECQDDVVSYIDVEKFERIFYNLISNAFKFTRPNDKIQLTLSDSKPGKYTIILKDTGIGIPKENQPYIFDRFYHIKSYEFDEHQGTGIGLSIVQELTNLHGGKINVTSTPDVGTQFSLEFISLKDKSMVRKVLDDYKTIITPDNQELSSHLSQNEIDHYTNLTDADSSTSEPKREEQKIEKQGKTIVVVEDNKDMRSYISGILKYDYEIIEAVDGAQGYETICNCIPDLVISDIMMPKLNGIELCKKLKTDIKTQHIPVIMLSARSTDTDYMEGFETGADDYIAKPFSRELLLLRISNLIESRDKLKEHFKTRLLIEPEHTTVESNIEKFLSQAIALVEKNIQDSGYGVEQFSSEIGISQAQLYRKLTSIIGQSPAEFIRTVRLKRAAKMLEESIIKDINISEIVYKLGFVNPSHFSKVFKKHYGVSPTEYAKKFK